MTDRPIIFRADMIRAILDGRKTMTRRVLKPQPQWIMSYGNLRIWHWEPGREQPSCDWWDGPPYIPITDALAIDHVQRVIGDRLWVRESFSLRSGQHEWPPWYWADGIPPYGQWEDRKPSIYMPRRLSRITLEVTGVKVERLHDISEEDARAEGADDGSDIWESATHAFSHLWNSIHATGAWEENPWVYAIMFKVSKDANNSLLGGEEDQ